MPSRRPDPETPAILSVRVVRGNTFALTCADDLRRYFEYVTVGSTSADEGTDILVQNEGGEPIPVQCIGGTIHRPNVQHFAESLLVRAFRRGLMLYGPAGHLYGSAGHQSAGSAGISAKARIEAESLQARGIDIRLLPLADLGALGWT